MKLFNKFILDTSRRGKYREDIVIHTMFPKFIAKIIVLTPDGYTELESSLANIPHVEVGHACKQLKSGNYLALIVIQTWDIVEAPADIEKMKISVKLALNTYYSHIIHQYNEGRVNDEEIDECINFIDLNISGSEKKYANEKSAHSEEQQVAYKHSIVILKWITKYLKQLKKTNSKIDL